MRIPVPSWVTAALGASVVAYTTTIGAQSLDRRDAEIEELSQSISHARQAYEVDRLTHVQATAQEAYAHLNFGGWTTCSALGANLSACTVTLSRAGDHLFAAIGLLDQTTDITNEDHQTTAALRGELSRGEEDAYAKLITLYGGWRIRSMNALNAKRDAFLRQEARRQQKSTERDSCRTRQLNFTLWGLVMLMLKDVPIWRRD